MFNVKKVGKILMGMLLASFVVALAATGYFFYKVEIRADKDFVPRGESPDHPLNGQRQAWERVPHKTDWTFVTPDDITLKGQFVPAAKETKKTAIVIHGFGVDHKTNIPYAMLMHDLGYNVLLADNRAAGASQGQFIGYGYLEAKDYLGWIDQIIAKQGADSEIVVYGTSLGGATTMLLSSMNPPKQVKAFIEDCGYTSVREELLFQANKMYHLPEWLAKPLIEVLSVYSKWFAGYDYNDAAPVTHLPKNDRPMLLIHGDSDTFVPSAMHKDLVAATNGPKDTLVIPGADHMEAYEKDMPRYEKKVVTFLNQYVA